MLPTNASPHTRVKPVQGKNVTWIHFLKQSEPQWASIRHHKKNCSETNIKKLSVGAAGKCWDCMMTRPRSVVQKLYIAQHGRQEIDI